MSRLKAACGPFFIAAGAMHFINPKFYRAIMPPWLPAHDELIAASGVAEIAGGLGLLHPATRRHAGEWLIATLMGVYPANIEMALHPERYSKIPGGKYSLWARLPIQGVFMIWVLAAMDDSGASLIRRDEGLGQPPT